MEKSNYNDMELITNKTTIVDNQNTLREKFVSEYATKKGWDISNLTNEQLTEIKAQKGYQCPGMICG